MAFADWTTITNYNQALYKTRASENFEFVISDSFKNPVFMVFWNSIKYNGTITGLSPVVSKVSGTRYKVEPYIRTPSKLGRIDTISAPKNGYVQYIVKKIPATRKISFAGYLYPTRVMGAMRGIVDIEVINPQNGSVIQKFSRVNMAGTSCMGSYWWFYAVPQQYYNSGVILRYTLTHATGDLGASDLFLILIENDLKWIDNGTGGLVSDGDNKALVDDAELTILVLEKGERE